MITFIFPYETEPFLFLNGFWGIWYFDIFILNNSFMQFKIWYGIWQILSIWGILVYIYIYIYIHSVIFYKYLCKLSETAHESIAPEKWSNSILMKNFQSIAKQGHFINKTVIGSQISLIAYLNYI
jgi:hypothetical protein